MSDVRVRGLPANAPLSAAEISDLVSLFLEDESGTVIVFGRMHPAHKGNRTRGLHMMETGGVHEIWLNFDLIKKSWEHKEASGGNIYVPDLKIATAMVLAHEVQHANQHSHHQSERSFYGRQRSRYRTRPSEVEARRFADEKILEIAAVLDIDLDMSSTRRTTNLDAELEDMINALSECEELEVSDLVEELRDAGMYNPINLASARQRLTDLGVVIR